MRNVYCIIPTHNRVKSLKNILFILKYQTYKSVDVIVIDDGSSDSTSEYLSNESLKNLAVIQGNGELWWGGSVAKGIDLALSLAGDKDYVLLLNDDSYFDQYYIKNMIDDCHENNSAVMVSPQYDSVSKELSFTGYQVNYNRQSITPVNEKEIDATVGRGLLLPVSVLREIGNVNARKFPHYMADIELTARIKDYNYSLCVAWNAPVYSDLSPSDQHVQRTGQLRSLFHRRSKSSVFDRLAFFHRRGRPWTRITALPRLVTKLVASSILSTMKN